VWKCADCREKFSVLVGSVFEDSKVPLSKWLLAFHMMCAGKNGVAAEELRRTLGVTYETAWFMAHRIADAMDQRPLGTLLSDTIEADETYIGDKAHGKRERGAANKTPVVSLVQRGGKVRSRVVTNVNGKNVKGILQANRARW